jgi:hypothetical protein
MKKDRRERKKGTETRMTTEEERKGAKSKKTKN